MQGCNLIMMLICRRLESDARRNPKPFGAATVGCVHLQVSLQPWFSGKLLRLLGEMKSADRQAERRHVCTPRFVLLLLTVITQRCNIRSLSYCQQWQHSVIPSLFNIPCSQMEHKRSHQALEGTGIRPKNERHALC